MASLFSETFESSGYDNTWVGGETVDAGCTLDEDYATSNISSPSGWGTYALRSVTTADGEDAYVQHYWADAEEDITYTHIEVYLADLSNISENANMRFLQGQRNGFTECYDLAVRYESGSYYFRFSIDDGGWTSYLSDSTVSQGNRYYVQIKIDNTNNAWEWRVDGVSQDSGTFSTDAGIRTYNVGHSGGEYGEIVIDNFKVDDSSYPAASWGTGETQSCAASVDSVSTASAAASTYFSAKAGPSIDSSILADLDVGASVVLTASSDGVSSVLSPQLSRTFSVGSSPSFASSVEGNLNFKTILRSACDGVAALTSALGRTRGIAALSEGVCAVTSFLNVGGVIDLATTVQAAGAAAAKLTVTWAIQASVTAAGTVWGVLTGGARRATGFITMFVHRTYRGR